MGGYCIVYVNQHSLGGVVVATASVLLVISLASVCFGYSAADSEIITRQIKSKVEKGVKA